VTEHNPQPTFDIESAEARLDEVVAGLKRHFADLEDAVEELKRCHRQPAPSPRPRLARKND
jgi:exonuclease VII small subunit